MSVELDETLIYRTRRKVRDDELSPDERVAINLFWRQGVRVPVLARVFGISKNTIYYKALTGYADSYPNTRKRNPAAETNAIIEKLGEEEAFRRFVKPEWTEAVNKEMARDLEKS